MYANKTKMEEEDLEVVVGLVEVVKVEDVMEEDSRRKRNRTATYICSRRDNNHHPSWPFTSNA